MKIQTMMLCAFLSSQTFFGPSGQFEGFSSSPDHSTVDFYGRSGQFDGFAVQSGPSTTFYGPSGQFEGFATGDE